MGEELTHRTTGRGGSLASSRRVVSARGERGRKHVGIAQRFHACGRYDSVLVTGKHWFASRVVLEDGELGFEDGGGRRVVPFRQFLLYVPPGALVRMPLGDARFETLGIAGAELPAGWPTRPWAIPCELDALDALREDSVGSVLAGAERGLCIDADAGVGFRDRWVRRELRERALSPSPVAHVASALGSPLAVLSRRFSASYGMSPRKYCQRLRIHAAVMALFQGASIAHTALDLGWQDLSRFYRQFRLATSETPGRYRRAGRG